MDTLISSSFRLIGESSSHLTNSILYLLDGDTSFLLRKDRYFHHGYEWNELSNGISRARSSATKKVSWQSKRSTLQKITSCWGIETGKNLKITEKKKTNQSKTKSCQEQCQQYCSYRDRINSNQWYVSVSNTRTIDNNGDYHHIEHAQTQTRRLHTSSNKIPSNTTTIDQCRIRRTTSIEKKKPPTIQMPLVKMSDDRINKNYRFAVFSIKKVFYKIGP